MLVAYWLSERFFFSWWALDRRHSSQRLMFLKAVKKKGYKPLEKDQADCGMKMREGKGGHGGRSWTSDTDADY